MKVNYKQMFQDQLSKDNYQNFLQFAQATRNFQGFHDKNQNFSYLDNFIQRDTKTFSEQQESETIQDTLNALSGQQLIRIYAKSQYFSDILSNRDKYPRQIDHLLWRLIYMTGSVFMYVQQKLINDKMLQNCIILTLKEVNEVAYLIIEFEFKSKQKGVENQDFIKFKEQFCSVYEMSDCDQDEAISLYNFMITIWKKPFQFKMNISLQNKKEFSQKYIQTENVNIQSQKQISNKLNGVINYKNMPNSLMMSEVSPFNDWKQNSNFNISPYQFKKSLQEINQNPKPKQRRRRKESKKNKMLIDQITKEKELQKKQPGYPPRKPRLPINKRYIDPDNSQNKIDLTQVASKPSQTINLIQSTFKEQQPIQKHDFAPQFKNVATESKIKIDENAKNQIRTKWTQQQQTLLVQSFIQTGNEIICSQRLSERFGQQPKFTLPGIKLRINWIVRKVHERFQKLITKNPSINNFKSNWNFISKGSNIVVRNKIYRCIMQIYTAMLNMGEDKRELVSRKLNQINKICVAERKEVVF